MNPPASPEPVPPTDAYTTPLPEPAVVRPVGHWRWTMCALLFFATTINYMDRQIIGILKPVMAKDLGWNDNDYANIVVAFQFAYAIGLLAAGRLIDLLGVRIGYMIAVLGWSLAAMATGMAHTVAHFAMARGALGLAEGGNFPAAIKAISEWFPRRDRALATGIFNAGSNVGAMITPLLVPFIALHWGWEAAFYVTGAVGLIWVVVWLAVYQHPDKHKHVTPAELAYIHSSDEPDTVTDAKEPFWNIVFRRSTMAYVAGLVLTSPVWWFYLFWGGDFLNRRFGLKLAESGVALAIVYLLADVGSVGGGWISSHLLKKGWSVNAARKTAMFIFCAMVVPVYFVTIVNNVWVATALLGVAAAAHQGWSANLYTLVSDTTAKGSVSTVIGLGGFVGGLVSMAVAKAVGYILEQTGSFYIPFAVASVMYLLALLAVHLLVPHIGAKEREPRGFEPVL